MLANCAVCGESLFFHTMCQEPIAKGPFCCSVECRDKYEPKASTDMNDQVFIEEGKA